MNHTWISRVNLGCARALLVAGFAAAALSLAGCASDLDANDDGLVGEDEGATTLGGSPSRDLGGTGKSEDEQLLHEGRGQTTPGPAGAPK
ncbi:MAG: hypothetical protein L0Y44_09880 [Phycisphaerales bacterium]|nr:hypothetical protein [Phycisphaerales bacterium]MCI0630946.1 hypothetical protein [Phycisphaerales bacterium]MCI0675063.1 hypothetical protein [Phycisphaerales bacterium]